MRILIIEDEPDIRKTIEYNFVKEGFKVSVAGSIAEGKKLFLADTVNLVILDLMLPDGSGLDLCREIKSNPSSASTPIIILTAKTDEVDRVVGFELGADDYVTKPFSVRELLLRVKAILKRAPSVTSESNAEQVVGNLRIDFDAHMEDEKTAELLASGKNIGITLAESPLIRKTLRELKPKSVHDIAICLNFKAS